MIIGTNFKLSSAKFLDDRQLCKDYNTLIANTEGIIYPPGFEVFCEYENKYYQYVSDTNGGYVWEERKSGVSDGTSASIKDDTISEEYTWSSAHIDSMRIDLEALITQANDYVDEIDERMLFIEGKFQWFEYFDGSYDSLTDKPIIPTKVSELENDSEFLGIERLELELEGINEKIDTKIDKEEDRTLISVTELERLSTVDNYNDTEVRQLIDELETQAHIHINSDILNTITEEKINQWDNNTGVDDYNYIQNKPITRVGDDSDILLNFGQIIDEGMYIITAMVGEYKIHNELVHVKWADDDNVTLTIPNMFMVLNVNRTDGDWTIVNELHYGVDKENGKISDTLTIGEDKIILNKEGNGWYGGKVSQEGIPTEDKDLVTKGYVDNKFATNERIEVINKENARRDVIIEALANGRKRTVETDGNDVDLMFSTEKDKVWIDKIEGDTMVNVCDQEEPIAITKSYTVEGTNHIPLQGEYDGKARPVVHGNTLVNHNVEYDKSVITGEKLDNTHGTEILNLEGTPGCEIKVDIDGHTAINLSTKKEDILCKSFDSVSGNEIDLVADKNSRTDVVVQGNTMVNLVDKGCNTRITLDYNNTYYADIHLCEVSRLKLDTPYTFVVYVTPLEGHSTSYNLYQVGFGTLQYGAMEGHGTMELYEEDGTSVDNVSTTKYYDPCRLVFKVIFRDFGQYQYLKARPFRLDYNMTPDESIRCHATVATMIFEGDLTQTPELIPTEYVEGLQSTFEDKLIPYSIYNGNNLTSITETQYQLPLTVEVGKTYTITTTANVGTTENHKYQYGVYSADGLTNYLEYESCSPTQTFVCDKANILFKVRMYPSYSGDDYSFVLDEVKDKFLIVEGDWSSRLHLLTDDYFGKYRVDMNSYGKNLIDGNLIEQGGINFVKGKSIEENKQRNDYEYYPLRCRTSKLTPIKRNTNYTISIPDGYSIGVQLFKDGLAYSDSGWRKGNNYTFNTYETDSFALTFHRDNQIITVDEVLSINIQLEEGSTVTEYEPYYGSSKTVYLNSPLLDGDELLTKDGKLYHYHKMGRVVLNGSEDWANVLTATNTIQFQLMHEGVLSSYDGLAFSDKFLLSYSNCQNNDNEHFYTENVNQISSLQIIISKSKLSTTDVNGFKQWLSENPTIVVYELAEPWYEPIGAYGKVMLDGREDWNVITDDASPVNTNYIRFYIDISDIKMSDYAILNCDKFTIKHGISKNTEETCISSHNEVKRIDVCINKSSLPTQNLDGFKQWLQQNPVTVIYELANPQYIDEDMKFNIATNSTIEYQSNVPMANTQFLPYRNELPLLESSTQYRVTFDCDVEGLELMVSLGGTSQTITSALHNKLSFITPSLQTDGKLTIDGYGIAKIDNVLITKGDMEYKYFEGLKSGFENKINLYDMSKIETDNNDSQTFSITSDNHMILKATDWDGFKINDLSNFKENTEYEIVVNIYKNELVGNEKLYIISDTNETQTDKDIFYTDTSNGINIIPGQLGKFTYYKTSLSDFSNCECVLRTILNIADLRCVECTIEIYEVGKPTIRIQNPNAPIFGKGGRL